MAYVTAVSRNTGDLITSGIWNQDVVDNPNFLKGLAGQIVFEDGASFAGDVVPSADELRDVGSLSLRWQEIHVSRRLQVGGYRVANRREERWVWEDDLTGTAQHDKTTSGSGATILAGGSGQVVLKVDNDAVGAARIDQRLLQNAAAQNKWDPDEGNIYYRVEIHLDVGGNEVLVFVGLRATPGSSFPGFNEEHVGFNHAAIVGTWLTTSSDGTAKEENNVDTEITLTLRHVLEFYQRGSSIEFWVDGVLLQTHTTRVPTASLTWEVFLGSDGSGGATDSHLTVGEMIIQEDVP